MGVLFILFTRKLNNIFAILHKNEYKKIKFLVFSGKRKKVS